MIIVGYNPGRYKHFTAAAKPFDPDMLDALYRAVKRMEGTLSPSVSIQLFGQTAEDFAEASWS